MCPTWTQKGGSTLKQKHKKVLFDQIRAEEAEKGSQQKSQWKIMLYNGLMNLTSSTFRLALIILVSIVGSIALTVLVTAIYQDSSPMEVWMDFIGRSKAFFT